MTPDRFEDHAWKDIVLTTAEEIYERLPARGPCRAEPALLLIDLYNLFYQGGRIRRRRFRTATPRAAYHAIGRSTHETPDRRSPGGRHPDHLLFRRHGPARAPPRVGADPVEKGVKRDPEDY